MILGDRAQPFGATEINPHLAGGQKQLKLY